MKNTAHIAILFDGSFLPLLCGTMYVGRNASPTKSSSYSYLGSTSWMNDSWMLTVHICMYCIKSTPSSMLKFEVHFCNSYAIWYIRTILHYTNQVSFEEFKLQFSAMYEQVISQRWYQMILILMKIGWHEIRIMKL